MLRRRLMLIAIAVAACATAFAARPRKKTAPVRPEGMPKGRLPWKRLFDGRSLKGWQVEGQGVWTVEDGCIVGRQNPKTHSESWLLSEAEWGDFVLVARFQITARGNSGIFFRAPKVRGHPGRMGYEMQIGGTDRRYPTGSIYDLAKAPPGLESGEWNRAMICCIGKRLFTSVNGRVGAVVEAPKARSAKGRVGFQVHGGINYSNMIVRFKDIYVAPIKAPAEARGGLRFRKVTLDLGTHEGAAVFDVDRDGKPDVVCGPVWYRNPTWKAYPIRDVAEGAGWWDLPFDVNGDGRTDLIAGGGFGKREHWYENPGRPGRPWTPHEYLERKGHIEDMIVADMDGNGLVNDLVPNGNGLIQWLQIAPGRKPKFTYRRVGSKGKGHGIGVGDISGDNRVDVVTPQGWYQQPDKATSSAWKWRGEFRLKGKPGVPIRVLDLNGDRAKDIVYGDTHGYGLWWLEQKRIGDTKRTWIEHVIDPSLAQAHSIAVGDINGDKRPDLVTGKRWQAGNGEDPGDHEPTGLYWYEHDGTGQNWKRHVIDFNGGAGCGMGLQLHDLDGDKDLDVVAPGKGGLYLFVNEGASR
ncbi:family 16 glycoside hydrolase [Planctomycetota bacterium]